MDTQLLSGQSKAVIRLIGGPADGLVFTVPKVRPFVAVGDVRYSREPGDGEVICYCFAPELRN